MAPTQADVARQLGISQVSVSAALNNKPGVSAELREKVLRTAKRLGYRTNRVARSLALRRTQVLGLIGPYSSHSFFAEITRGITDAAAERGYQVVLCHPHNDTRLIRRQVDLLLEMQADGLIIVPLAEDSTLFQRLLKSGLPFVLVDRYFPDIHCNYVVTDAFTGAREMTRHLIRIGYRRIAHIRGQAGVSFSDDVFLGFKAEMETNGIEIDMNLVVEGSTEVGGGYRAMTHLLEQPARPEAVFCVNDLSAIGALSKLREVGIAVPGEIALTGFSDVEAASFVTPPLTTVKEPTVEMGRTAAQIVIDQVEGKRSEPVQIMLKPKLIVRESCGAKTRQAYYPN